MSRPIRVSCAIIEYNGKVLAAKRRADQGNAGFWEFPGGKIQPGETTEECLHREIMEELNIQVSVRAALPPFSHDYSDKSITLYPFVCNYDGAKIIPGEHERISWLLAGDLYCLRWSEADIKVLDYYVKTFLKEMT